jgi:hypothetical protein
MANLQFGAIALAASALCFSESTTSAAVAMSEINHGSTPATIALSSVAIETFQAQGVETTTSNTGAASENNAASEIATFASYDASYFEKAVAQPHVVAVVPEPATYGIISGLALCAVALRRRFRK